MESFDAATRLHTRIVPAHGTTRSHKHRETHPLKVAAFTNVLTTRLARAHDADMTTSETTTRTRWAVIDQAGRAVQGFTNLSEYIAREDCDELNHIHAIGAPFTVKAQP